VRQQLTTHQFNAAYIDSNSWQLANTWPDPGFQAR
jgi:hypothetical protein